MALNSEIYNEDDKKFIFILSYMMKGMAKAWKEAFVQNVISWENPTFGSYKEFHEDVHKAFAAADIEGDVQEQPFDNFDKEMEPSTIIFHNSESYLEEPK